jgi:hypothetical protein
MPHVNTNHSNCVLSIKFFLSLPAYPKGRKRGREGREGRRKEGRVNLIRDVKQPLIVNLKGIITNLSIF